MGDVMRDGGMLKFYSLRNVAQKPLMPAEKLVLSGQAYFDYRTIGVQRMYAAAGADRRIDLLVRARNTIVPHDCAFVMINDEQYRIDAQQRIKDDVDLTLVRLEDRYDVAE